ncbi:MAG: CbiQ family ECF transporter T component [Sulfurimicrobium sp.]|nr:CbiQ family ECF transporter T component [Sulfurimicrobium sp.]
MAAPWGAFHLSIVIDLQIHPATKILLWLGFALAVQTLDFAVLMLVSVLAILWLALLGGLSEALFMLRRARWLLLSLLLVYAFATPGDLLSPLLGAFSPSLPGLRGGALQAWRLALLLVALALLLRSCPRESLLSGLYVLMRPFRAMGLNPERVAVRLWLTLHYARQQSRQKMQAWRDELRSALDPAPNAALHVTLELPVFTWRDVMALVLATFMLGAALW